jgi:hypothetical protein
VAELDDQISRLRKQLKFRRLRDCAGVTGQLGCALLERYLRDTNPDDLSEAIERLATASESAPGHPDRFGWYLALGVAYGAAAQHSHTVADYDRGIDWVARSCSRDTGHNDHATPVLANLHIARFHAGRYQIGWPPERIREEVTALVDTLAELAQADPDRPYTPLLRMQWGAFLVARYEVGGVAGDLDRGITLLEEGLAVVLPAEARRAGTVELANGYRLRASTHRHDTDRDHPDDLDRAIELSAQAIRGGDPEQPEWVYAHRHHAAACQDRWLRDRRPVDLDQAIACWRVVDQAQPSWLATLSCGWLLQERATGTGDRDELIEATRYAERALRYDGLDGDDILLTHQLRLRITEQLLDHEVQTQRGRLRRRCPGTKRKRTGPQQPFSTRSEQHPVDVQISP